MLEVQDDPRILVAEDDTTLGSFLRHYLEKEGYKPTIVESGRETIQLAQSNPYDLIMLDMTLTDTDGLSVCHVLKNDARTSNIPVLFLTGRNEVDSLVTALDAGAQDYMCKPFEMQELLARLRAILREHQEIKESREQIRQKQQQIATIITHEMRGPLTVISMASKILTENHQLSRERHDQLIESIRGSVGTLSQVIDDLLYIAYPTRHLKQTNINELMSGLENDIRARMQEYNLRLSLRIPDKLPHLVVDDHYLRRGLHHLVDNAIKFTQRGGIIKLSVAVYDPEISREIDPALIPPKLLEGKLNTGWMVFGVTDTGIGIAPEHHQSIFEPFFQVDSSEVRKTEGMGLGLAVVLAFVRAHYGQLTIQSDEKSKDAQLTHGTAIHIALPLHAYMAEPPLTITDPDGPGIA